MFQPNLIRVGIPEVFATQPLDQAGMAEEVWQELQADLAGLSANSRTLVAEKSGHRVQMDQLEFVVEAIREMVETHGQIE